MAARRHLLEQQRVHLPRKADQPPPSTLTALRPSYSVLTTIGWAALSRTLLAGILAQSSRDY